MKISVLLFLAIILTGSLFSQEDVWRPNEKEVKVFVSSSTDAAKLMEYKFNGDYYSEFANLYLVPEELKVIENIGLKYEILKEDLNDFSKNFWSRQTTYHTYQEVINLMLFAFTSELTSLCCEPDRDDFIDWQ